MTESKKDSKGSPRAACLNSLYLLALAFFIYKFFASSTFINLSLNCAPGVYWNIEYTQHTMKLLLVWMALMGLTVALQQAQQAQQAQEPPSTFVTAVHPPQDTDAATPRRDVAMNEDTVKDERKRTNGQDTSDMGPSGTTTKTPALPPAPTNTKIPVGASAGDRLVVGSKGLMGLMVVIAIW